MRLIIDGRRLTLGRTGVGRVLEILLEEWAQIGLPLSEGVLLVQDSKVLGSLPKVPGLEMRSIGGGWPGLAWELCGLGRILKHDDLLFAAANLVPWTWRGKTLLFLFDMVGDVLPRSQPWRVRKWYGWRYRMAAARADRILAPSKTTADDISNHCAVEQSRIQVVPLASALGFQPRTPDDPCVLEAKRSVGLAPDQKFFLFVGKRSLRRNIGLLLEAFQLVHQVRKEYRLVLIGPGSDKEQRELQRSPGVSAPGHVSEVVLHGLASAASSLVWLSLHEGFGLPLVEAMASGCPVVALRTRANEEVLGSAACYLETLDAEALAGSLLHVAESAETRNQLIANGLERARIFDRRVCAISVASAIQDLAEVGSGSPRPATRGRTSAPERLVSADT